MASDLEERMTEWMHMYLGAKRSFEAIEEVIALAEGKDIRNDFAWDAFWALVAGVILELCIIDEYVRVELITNATSRCTACNRGGPRDPGPLGKLLTRNLSDLQRDGWRDFTDGSDAEHDRLIRQDFQQTFDRLFPQAAVATRNIASIDDLADFSDQLGAAVQPLRNHRNTLIAHRDRSPKAATFEEIRAAFAKLNTLTHDLVLVATGTNQHMALGGGASPKRFAADLVELMRSP